MTIERSEKLKIEKEITLSHFLSVIFQFISKSKKGKDQINVSH